MRRKLPHGLTLKLALFVIVTAVVLSIMLNLTYRPAVDRIIAEGKRAAEEHAVLLAKRLDADLVAVATTASTLALAIERSDIDETSLLGILTQVVRRKDLIFGSTAAFEPYAFKPDHKAYAPYFYKAGTGVALADLGTDSYNYFAKDWYTEPKKHETPVWSEPYYDEGGGNELMTTFSAPFFFITEYGYQAAFRGVVTADVSIPWLTRRVAREQYKGAVFNFLISAKGTLLVYPEQGKMMNGSLTDVAREMNDESLTAAARTILAEESGVVEIGPNLIERDAFIAFSKVSSTGWTLGVVVPREEVLADLVKLRDTQYILLTGIVTAMLVLGLMLAKSIAGPLRRMARETARVAKGDLNVDLSAIQSSDEVGTLARAFEQMTTELQRHITELTETTAAKERIESELSVAAHIQHSMVPSQFPAFPERDDFDIYAVMQPAKQVGGDFHNFFLIDDDHVCVTIGDVSDKGVPAALFMAVTVFLIRAIAVEGASPSRILDAVNRRLCPGNDSCMFVTIFVGVLNLRTGDLTYANAGHPPALIVKPEGTVAETGPPTGPAVGIMPDAEFSTACVRLERGDLLFAYTDGVTEAFNPEQDQYSEERLQQLLRDSAGNSPRDVIENVLQDLLDFSDDAPQSDDTTMLAIRIGDDNV